MCLLFVGGCKTQVLTTVSMLHDNLVVHRDVKPENLLLRKADGSLDDIVLIDFGLSRFFEPGQRLTTRVGTVYYTAPEVIGGESNTHNSTQTIK